MCIMQVLMSAVVKGVACSVLVIAALAYLVPARDTPRHSESPAVEWYERYLFEHHIGGDDRLYYTILTNAEGRYLGCGKDGAVYPAVSVPADLIVLREGAALTWREIVRQLIYDHVRPHVIESSLRLPCSPPEGSHRAGQRPIIFHIPK